MQGVLKQLWNIFNTLQLITGIPSFGINTPSNIILINETVERISNFKLIPDGKIYDAIIVPIFGTSTSEEKLEEVGTISTPINNNSTNILETAAAIESDKESQE